MLGLLRVPWLWWLHTSMYFNAEIYRANPFSAHARNGKYTRLLNATEDFYHQFIMEQHRWYLAIYVCIMIKLCLPSV